LDKHRRGCICTFLVADVTCDEEQLCFQKTTEPNERLKNLESVESLDKTQRYRISVPWKSRLAASIPAMFALFWVTHLCAPTFIFLAGLSAFLYGRRRDAGDLSRFLLIRGFWLILIDFTLIKFGWRFEVDPFRMTGGVIFVIGISMMALAALVWLPRWVIACMTFIMLAGHNLLDSVRADELGGASWAWHLLHEPGLVPLGDGVNLYVLYPLIPWIGVMAAGYLLGPVTQLEGQARHRSLEIEAGRVHEHKVELAEQIAPAREQLLFDDVLQAAWRERGAVLSIFAQSAFSRRAGRFAERGPQKPYENLQLRLDAARCVEQRRLDEYAPVMLAVAVEPIVPRHRPNSAAA